jgi:hypothetical protein
LQGGCAVASNYCGNAAYVVPYAVNNDATSYQTVPARQPEGTVLQHLGSGWRFGANGDILNKIDDDSGSGVETTRTGLEADSLRVRFYRVGPMVTFSGGEVLGAKTGLKASYVSDFGMQRRFECDVFSATMSLAF